MRLRGLHSTETSLYNTSTVEKHSGFIGRRLVSLILSSLIVPVEQSFANPSPPGNEVHVGPGDDLIDIINQASPGSVICVDEGEYTIDKTLEIQKPITVRGASMQTTTLSLSTETPYHPVFHVAATSEVTLQDMTVRHRSPSVANNYAVYLDNASDCTLCNLDISSSTGTGISIEGIQHGTIRIQNCTIHDCARNGLGLFPSIEDAAASQTEIVVQGTRIERNKGHGIVAKGIHDKVTIMDDCEVHFNRLFGLQVSDSDDIFLASENILSKNISGAISVEDEYSRIQLPKT